MRFTVRQAADTVGISRKTLYKHISIGKVSAHVDTDGHKYVDKSELLRVYGKLMETPKESRQSPNDRIEQLEKELEKTKYLAQIFKLHYENEKKQNALLESALSEAKKDKEVFRQLFDRFLPHKAEG